MDLQRMNKPENNWQWRRERRGEHWRQRKSWNDGIEMKLGVLSGNELG